tara:strand:+ start:260 stop:769 length:510 start_codon:yes stop_codon:yes gene_type:complete
VILEVKRTYLEIKSIKDLKIVEKPNDNCSLVQVDPPDIQLNKFLYKHIGKKYRWIDRLHWDQKKWSDYLNKPNIKTFVLKEKENLIGFFEQIIENNYNFEIAYFGILEEYFGKKYGKYLLSEAIKNSFFQNAQRVWVHTCSLDHKNALSNYQARGMKIFKSENIIINDN